MCPQTNNHSLKPARRGFPGFPKLLPEPQGTNYACSPLLSPSTSQPHWPFFHYIMQRWLSAQKPLLLLQKTKSQHPYDGSQLLIIPATGDLIPSSDICWCLHAQSTHTYIQVHMHTHGMNFKKCVCEHTQSSFWQLLPTSTTISFSFFIFHLHCTTVKSASLVPCPL